MVNAMAKLYIPMSFDAAGSLTALTGAVAAGHSVPTFWRLLS
jgi:hypothetical protein